MKTTLSTLSYNDFFSFRIKKGPIYFRKIPKFFANNYFCKSLFKPGKCGFLRASF